MFLEDKAKNPGVKTKLKPYTLDHLIQWLEGQPASRTYDWPDCFGCLMYHYYKACGYDKDGHGTSYPRMYFDEPFRPWAKNGGDMRPYHYVGASKPWTFGAALKRAKNLRDNGLPSGFWCRG